MRLIFDKNMLRHINESAIAENGAASRVMLMLEALLNRRAVVRLLWLIESILSRLLTLPIPVYSALVHGYVTNARGLPSIHGMYLRGLYYRRKLRSMEPNVFIDQGVFIAHPDTLTLKEFAFLDKGVTIMARNVSVGRRVHIAPNVFVSGGGELEIEDYACVATNTSIITSTEILRDGARCSGPMVSADQRNVHRGKVLIEKDAFVGPSVTILPDVTISEGSVVASGVSVSKSTDPWGIYVGPKSTHISKRDEVRHPDN